MAQKTNTTSSKPEAPKDKKGVIDDRPSRTSLPSKRSSEPDASANYNMLGSNWTAVPPSYIREVIPIIRALMIRNGDVGQAIHNIVTLGNTGHKLFFDRKRTPDEVDAMRNHINTKRKEWAPGQAGMDGLVNRFISQILIGGANSAEWVPNNTLTGIESVILVGPEHIEFKLNDRGTKYLPYQRIKNTFNRKKKIKAGEDIALVPLNPNTYKYFALNGDGELPYGFPPYMSVLPRISTQARMDKNIDFVVDEWGLLGFIEALITKPDQGDKTDAVFDAELDNLLQTAKTRIMGGVKEGVIVGFKDDHEFDFHSASKSYSDAVELYNNNELMAASSLKQDASMWGRSYSTSETQITIVFIKMLSELRNIQNIVKNMLEFGYALELLLAGFTFDTLEVKFNKSTIQDDLKYQQSEEIKIRNVQSKMILGVIDQDQAADELGYEVPANPKPMVSWEVLAGGSDPAPLVGGTPAAGAKKKSDTKKKKTASDTKKRQQKKAVPK